MSLVLDSSIAIAWLMPDEAAETADRAILRTMDEGADVPALFGLEVANVLLVSMRRQRIAPEAVAAGLTDLSAIEIRAEAAPSISTLREISDLAARHRLTAYDAAYLELARRLGATLATLDVPLATAARAESVAVFGG